MHSSIRVYSSKSPALAGNILQIPQPPASLYGLGADLGQIMRRPRVAIIGSRKPTPYGKQVTAQLANALSKAGVVIVSGLALGVDGIAHQATLEANGTTMAILPGDLEHIYPQRHTALARSILAGGGVLLSEYAACSRPYKSNFVARNRLIAGLSDVVVITEAAAKSGSLHTAQFALEAGKEVFAVPGHITNLLAAGCNNLLRCGATILTSPTDVLQVLGLAAQQTKLPVGDTPAQQSILTLLAQGISDGVALLDQSELSASIFNQELTLLEIQGRIRPLGSNHWMLI